MNSSIRDYLLISANIGSTFEYPDRLFKSWIDNITEVIKLHEPLFIAIHCQEVGGKNYEDSMQYVDNFIKMILQHKTLVCYDKSRIYLDEDFTVEDRFTALGSLYFIHESVNQVEIWNFQNEEYSQVHGREIFSANIEHVPHNYKEKYPLDFFPEQKWSRKGFMHTKWRIMNQEIDLINIHLFHDICNITPIIKDPDTYASNRRNALYYTINKISREFTSTNPLFIFGDFNFRLNCQQMLQKMIEPVSVLEQVHRRTHKSSEEQVPRKTLKSSEDQVHKLIYRAASTISSNSSTLTSEMSNEQDQMISCYSDKLPLKILEVGRRHFEFLDEFLPFIKNYKYFRQFDVEFSNTTAQLDEVPIFFPPSYPFSEEDNCPTNYMRTRCPSWCDRILFNRHSMDIVDKQSILYNMIGLNVCMGDHKPIYLAFHTKSRNTIPIHSKDDVDKVPDSNIVTEEMATANVNQITTTNTTTFLDIENHDNSVAAAELLNDEINNIPQDEPRDNINNGNDLSNNSKNNNRDSFITSGNRRQFNSTTSYPTWIKSEGHRYSIVDSINGIRPQIPPLKVSYEHSVSDPPTKLPTNPPPSPLLQSTRVPTDPMNYHAPVMLSSPLAPSSVTTDNQWNIFDNARFDKTQLLDVKFRQTHRLFGSVDDTSLGSTNNTMSFAGAIKQVVRAESVLNAFRTRTRRISESSSSSSSDDEGKSAAPDKAATCQANNNSVWITGDAVHRSIDGVSIGGVSAKSNGKLELTSEAACAYKNLAPPLVHAMKTKNRCCVVS